MVVAHGEFDRHITTLGEPLEADGAANNPDAAPALLIPLPDLGEGAMRSALCWPLGSVNG
ncbi:hypothetical protein [Nocardia sp. CA-135398]|uniref:hypothetical protein n=1 Tax=Nocardia sp. CA-135398 TaxID=3239977 RepID=UPI003D99561E